MAERKDILLKLSPVILFLFNGLIGLNYRFRPEDKTSPIIK
jgi:hypothetical protein